MNSLFMHRALLFDGMRAVRWEPSTMLQGRRGLSQLYNVKQKSRWQ